MSKGYRGFESKADYEAHYSDPAAHASEVPAMEAYSREAKAERDVLKMKEVLDFLDSIEGAGYGGMAAFEIARMNVRDALSHS